MAVGPNSDLVGTFRKFLSEYYDNRIRELASEYPKRKDLYISYGDVKTFSEDLAERWLKQPRMTTEYAEEAVRLYEHPYDAGLGLVSVRLTGLSTTVNPREISADDAETLVQVTGRIVQTGDVETRVREAGFECQRCGVRTHIPQQKHGKLEKPSQCQGCERQGPFRISEAQSEFGEKQRVLIEGLPSGHDGASPEQIEVLLTRSLTGSVSVGDVVKVTGVVEANHVDGQVFEMLIDAVTVEEAESASVERWRDTYLGRGPAVESSNVDEDAFATFVKRSREVIQQGGNLDEDNTKAKIVTPFIHALGWNIFDGDEVELEYPRRNDEFDDRVDYALFDGQKPPRVLVEAKQVDAFLDSHTGQVKRYMRLFGAELGVLTNGERYMVYQQVDGDAPDETLLLDCVLEELQSREEVLVLLGYSK